MCRRYCDAYLKQVIDYVKLQFQTEQIYAYATSFGGYLTLKYISDHGNPFRKIALRCPAVNMYDVLTKTIMSSEDLKQLQAKKEILVGFDRKVPLCYSFLEELQNNDIQKMNYPEYAEDILILHGTADEIVPFDAAYTFAENNLIDFVPVEGADHRFRDANKMEQAIKQILTFYGL